MEEEKKQVSKERKINALDFMGFIKYVQKRLRWVVLAGAMGMVLSAVYCFFLATPLYESTAQLYVVNSQDSAINLSDLQLGSYLANDYQWIFKTWEVNQQVINNLNLPYSVEQIRKKLTVENPNNTRILTITFKSANAKESAEAANEYAAVASQYISDYMLTGKPTVISTALEPLKPSYPRKKIVIAAASLLSALLAVWVLFILFVCDDKIKTAEDIRRYMNVEPMAIIPSTHLIYKRGKNA